MITIYKYPFNVADRVEVHLPRGARVLNVGMQQGSPFLWAMVDTKAAAAPRRFLVFGTGRPINPERQRFGQHIATFQDGMFVWHVFENIGAAEVSP